MHRDLKLSYIRWCDKLGISTTTVANIEMVPRTLGVNSWKLPVTTTSTSWTKRWTGDIVRWNLHLRGERSEKRFPASYRWEESIDRIFMVVGWGITIPGGVGGSDWIVGCGRRNRSHSCRTTFLFQEVSSASGIPSEGGWAGLLFLLAVQGQGHLRPGVKREGEGGTNVEREVDSMPWLVSVWQKSKHLMAKEELALSTAVILVYFWISNCLEGPDDHACFRSFHKW